MLETIKLSNKVEVTKVLDENRKQVEYWKEYLGEHKIEEENEFYVLFSTGLLVKKGRTKFKSSEYLSDEKKTMPKFKDFYNAK